MRWNKIIAIQLIISVLLVFLIADLVIDGHKREAEAQSTCVRLDLRSCNNNSRPHCCDTSPVWNEINTVQSEGNWRLSLCYR